MDVHNFLRYDQIKNAPPDLLACLDDSNKTSYSVQYPYL